MSTPRPLPVTIRAYPSEAGDAWTSAVYQNLPCGCTVAEFEVVGRIPGYDPGRPSPSRDTKQPS